MTRWTIAHQAPLSMRFSRQEYWSGLLCPPPGDLPDPGIEPMSLMSPALAGRFFTTSATWKPYLYYIISIMLLLLSRFSCVRLCATPETATHQAPPSLGFSKPFPSPMHESEISQSYLTLCDPMDCSLPGSSVHGIFQARVLEWGAIAFSSRGGLLLLLSRFSRVRPCVTP